MAERATLGVPSYAARVDGFPARRVTLVLCTAAGNVLGVLPPFTVSSPWWRDARGVVAAARALYDIDVTVLRLLSAVPAGPPAGGPVSYLAEVDATPDLPLAPGAGDPVTEDSRRLSWARPGGPAEDLAWADRALAAHGVPRTEPAEQVRTWNLSSIWRLPTPAGPAWLKVVPPFLTPESSILPALDPALVAPVIAAEGPRVLLGDVAGEDQYDAPASLLLRMVGLLVALQTSWAPRVDMLLGLGLPDWRGPQLSAPAEDLLVRSARSLDRDIVATLEQLIGGLERRVAEIEACGVPDSLVHGDFHPGNFRGAGEQLRLLDWGDCGVGHPLLDHAAFVERMDAQGRQVVQAAWMRSWQDAVPGSDPERAARLLEPVSALRAASVYRRFLDHIEPAERVYHAEDPALWLRRAAELSDRGGSA